MQLPRKLIAPAPSYSRTAINRQNKPSEGAKCPGSRGKAKCPLPRFLAPHRGTPPLQSRQFLAHGVASGLPTDVRVGRQPRIIDPARVRLGPLPHLFGVGAAELDRRIALAALRWPPAGRWACTCAAPPPPPPPPPRRGCRSWYPALRAFAAAHPSRQPMLGVDAQLAWSWSASSCTSWLVAQTSTPHCPRRSPHRWLCWRTTHRGPIMLKHGPLAWLAVAAVVLLAVISTADAQQLAAAPRKRTIRPARGAAPVS